MNKTIYIPEDKKAVLKEAEHLFKGEKSLSQLIIESLEKTINDKRRSIEFEAYIVNDGGLQVQLIAKKIATFIGTYDKNAAIPWQEGTNDEKVGKEGYIYHEINGYQTKKGRLFVERKTISCEYTLSSLQEIRGLWEVFKKSEYNPYVFVDIYIDYFPLPPKFMKDMFDDLDDKLIEYLTID